MRENPGMTSDAARRWARRLRRLVTGVPFLVTASVIVVLFVAYTLAGFFLVPRLIATYVPRYAHEQLGRRAEVGEVRANPLLFRLEIKDFRLQEADGRPLLGFDRFFVDFELSSLFRAAWTFAEIQLEEPRLDVVLHPDGRLNVGELLDAFPRGEADETAEATRPPRVLLQHAVVRGGRLSFTDLSGRAPQTAVVDPIDVELHDITTLRDRRGPYAISATLIGGGTVGWDGEVSLFPLGSTGRVGIRGFPLATAWRFVQGRIALAEPAGRVDADVRYQLAYRDGATSATVDGLEVVVAGLALTERGEKTPLLALDRIGLTGGSGDLVARELTVPEISVSRGRLAATMDRDGTVNWQNVMIGPRPQAAGPDTVGTSAPPAGAAPARGATPRAPAPPPPAGGPGVRPWRIALDKVRVEDVALSFSDRSRAAHYRLDVAGVSLDLSARLESGPAGLTGTAQGVDVKLSRVAVREATGARTPLASLDGISVEGGRVDLGSRQVAVSRVAATGGTTTVIRAADGSIPVLTMLEPADRSRSGRPSAPAPARPSARAGARPAPAAASKPWTVALAKLDLANHRLAVADRSVTPAVELELDRINVGLRGVRSDGKKPWPFDASLRVKQGGRLMARGRVAPDGRAADVTLTLAGLALTPAQPYVAATAAVRLLSGNASGTGRLTYRAGRDRAAVTYTGSADIDGVRVVEEATGDPVLAWKSAHARNLRFRLAPDGLEIDEVRLTELDASVVILEDRSLNLARLMKGSGAAPSADDPADTAVAAFPAEGNATPGFPVVVERVRIDDSSMDFADLSLILPFATRVHALNGVVAGLGSDPGTRATVKLDGQVDEFGLLKVGGSITPFHPKLFTDLEMTFRGVPMPTLTPYSATFAGRHIVAGTMDLDLEYKIERSALVGDHKIVLRRLQLGERVESPGATRLPLDLAIAILSDSQGRIEIALPVRGNVDRPEFSYRHLIWQALASLIRRVVTAPFRALAGLLGGDAERLETVAFEAGSDVVLPPERQKLARVAEALGKRPRLKLTVHGGYEANVDGEALRSFRVRRELARRLGVELGPGEDPGPVAFDHAKTQRALEAMLNERAGSSEAIEEFETSYERRTGKKAQRANPVLALLNRGSPDREFYEALFRRLVETTSLADAELENLARRRGEAVARVIQEGAGTVGARVEVGDAEAARRAEKNAVPTRLELGAVGS
jgi:uncharacterized protein involved in outer membrane biogenesis